MDCEGTTAAQGLLTVQSGPLPASVSAETGLWLSAGPTSAVPVVAIPGGHLGLFLSEGSLSAKAFAGFMPPCASASEYVLIAPRLIAAQPARCNNQTDLLST